jgi:hypothetical protein
MINVGKLISFIIVAKHRIHFASRFRLSNPNIGEWMKTMNISNATGIHTYYADRILNITRNITVTPIVWQDVWDEHVDV